MPNFLIGTSYAVSVGLIVYSIETKLAPVDWRFPLVMIWAAAGILLAMLAIMWPRRATSPPPS